MCNQSVAAVELPQASQSCVKAPCPPRAAVAADEEPDFDAGLVEDLIDALFTRGAAGELLAQYQRDERQIRERIGLLSKCQGVLVPTGVRELCLGVINACIRLQALPEESCYRAVTFLDAYCASKSGDFADCLATLPAACVAACQLAGKLERSSCLQTSSSLRSTMAMVAVQFAAKLFQMGYELNVEVSAETMSEQIAQQEHAITDAIQWRVTCPTVKSWLQLRWDRLDVLTRGQYSHIINWAQKASDLTARSLILRCPTFADGTSPQQIANGLMCIYLGQAGLVPLLELKPPLVREVDWQTLFCGSQCQATLPSCTQMNPNSVNGFLYLLQTVAGCGFETLQEDMQQTMRLMLDLVRRGGEQKMVTPSIVEHTLHQV